MDAFVRFERLLILMADRDSNIVGVSSLHISAKKKMTRIESELADTNNSSDDGGNGDLSDGAGADSVSLTNPSSNDECEDE